VGQYRDGHVIEQEIAVDGIVGQAFRQATRIA